MSDKNNDRLIFNSNLQISKEEQERIDKWRIKIMEEMYDELKYKIDEVIQSIGRPTTRYNMDESIIKEQIEFYQEKAEYDFENYKLISHVKDYLDEINRKLSWLQEKTQIPYSTLRSIILNTNAVSLENAFKISIALGVSIDKLFTFSKIENGD